MSELVFDKWDLERAQANAEIMALWDAMTPEDRAELMRYARQLLEEHNRGVG